MWPLFVGIVDASADQEALSVIGSIRRGHRRLLAPRLLALLRRETDEILFSEFGSVDTEDLLGRFIEIVRVDVLRVDAIVEPLLAMLIVVYIHGVFCFVSQSLPHLTCAVNVRQSTISISTAAIVSVVRTFT
jgi:hypothetical protein